MRNLETYFNKSQTLNEYINEMQENKDNLLSIYNSFHLPLNDARLNQLIESNYSKVLIITEDWCGDAMMNIPILKHIIEFLNIEARVFHRDDDTHLIDQYLTNGKSRAIPIFVFMNDSFEQLTVWGPRAKEVQSFVNKIRSSKLPDKTHPNFEERLKETHFIISQRYKTDSIFWKSVFNSIINQLLYK